MVTISTALFRRFTAQNMPYWMITDIVKEPVLLIPLTSSCPYFSGLGVITVPRVIIKCPSILLYVATSL